MTELIYVVRVRGIVPVDLARKVTEAHAEALKSRRRLKKRKAAP